MRTFIYNANDCNITYDDIAVELSYKLGIEKENFFNFLKTNATRHTKFSVDDTCIDDIDITLNYDEMLDYMSDDDILNYLSKETIIEYAKENRFISDADTIIDALTPLLEDKYGNLNTYTKDELIEIIKKELK